MAGARVAHGGTGSCGDRRDRSGHRSQRVNLRRQAGEEDKEGLINSAVVPRHPPQPRESSEPSGFRLDVLGFPICPERVRYPPKASPEVDLPASVRVPPLRFCVIAPKPKRAVDD
jgi:hypothetical protein